MEALIYAIAISIGALAGLIYYAWTSAPIKQEEQAAEALLAYIDKGEAE